MGAFESYMNTALSPTADSSFSAQTPRGYSAVETKTDKKFGIVGLRAFVRLDRPVNSPCLPPV